MDEFTVRREKHGLIVFGSLPVSDFNALAKAWDEAGYKWMRPDIADVLGAVVALVRSEEDATAWRAELDIRLDHPDWLRSGDTGISSKTIYATFTGCCHILQGSPAAPRDADDFGRCYRLLQRHPEWRARLNEVAAKCGEFAPLIPIWNHLEALYSSGDHQAVTQQIQAAQRAA